MYGQWCQKLALRIPGPGDSLCELIELLHQQCKYLTSLRVLILDVRLDESAYASDKRYESFDISLLPSKTKMGAREVRCWKELCSALPRLVELHLHGFLWSDAALGFAKADLSSVRTFGLNLHAPSLSAATARTFHQAFLGLVNITFPRKWCPDSAWVRQAFAGRRLQKIIVSGVVSWESYFNDGHVCSSEVCNWAEAFEELLELNAASLTSLKITSDVILEMSPERVALPRLTSLVFEGIDFNNDEENFEDIMRPFLQSPLEHLALDNCRGVPESFCNWFDPASGRWPGLKTLSLEQLETQYGPGDDLWDEADPEEREGWDRAEDDPDDVYWRSHTRIALEDMCTKRGIQFNSQWYWFEGYG
jgi:hypothetical protein